MEYFVIIVLLLYGIINYDFKSKYDRNDIYFKFIFVLMTLMSGLAFRMGADLVRYENDFYSEYSGDIKSLFQSFTFLGYRQFGWVLLSAIVYKITHSFVVFKLIQAFFFHFSLFKLIKEHTNYRYIALLLYFLLLFPHINFNVLRESFAIAFFFFSVPYLEKAKWIKYYAMVFCAIMFHSGAIILALVPLVSFLNLTSTKNFVLVSVAVFIFAVVIAPKEFVNQFMNLLALAEMEHINDQINFYLSGNDNVGIKNVFKTLLFYVINALPILFLSKKNELPNKYLLGLAFLYLVIDLFRAFFPIVYRFCDYFQPIWFTCVSIFIVDFTKNKIARRSKAIVACILILLYVYPVRSYFAINERYGAPSIVQYYPYYSVIHKGYSPERERLFSR